MSKNKVIAVIPARMGSSRFPGKPIASIAGLPMIEHVRRRVELAGSIDEVVVATCDQEIMDVVEKSGGKAVMTANTHERCTDRVAEAMQSLDGDIVVIVQGDEPMLMPDVLDRLVEPFFQDPSVYCTNIVSRIQTQEDFEDVDVVKALLSETKDIMWFTRAPAPYQRVEGERPMYRQTGLSAFKRDFLTTFTDAAETQLEIIESVDFLRIVGHGYKIRAVVHDDRTIGVDRPEDVKRIEEVLENDPKQAEIFRKISL
ncbi:MAG: 3-deoxy-manno-octulosonate cytidylyltransferase [Alphaproteobacteria bacterium]|nr:3-deoxy-manno-octulosonate cytidylyltransferase [Alphaproteobacteria bacterium]